MSADVTIDNCCAVGSNSIVMPGNHIPLGTVIGALSFVPTAFEFQPWGVYAGIPIQWIRSRNQEQVLAQAEKLDEFFKNRGRDE
jgi:acetyltransferase-like isoleucine patch superfamily enzyme